MMEVDQASWWEKIGRKSSSDHLNVSAKQLQSEPSLKNFDAHIIELIDSEVDDKFINFISGWIWYKW